MSEISVLIAMRGAAEEAVLRHLGESSGITISRRCADGAELIAAAIAGIGGVAVIDAELGVDRSFVQRLRAVGVLPIVIAPAEQHPILEQWGARALDPEPEDFVAALMVLLEDKPAHAIPQEPTPRARDVIAVMSPWGSPGRTTIAANLAAEIAERGGSPLLVDADLWGASIKQYLGLSPDAAGLAAAMRGVERGTFDLEGLSRLTEECQGIEVLGGLNKSDRWREVSGAALAGFWEVVNAWPGHVVIDSPVWIPCSEDDPLGHFGPAPNAMWESIREVARETCLVGSADTVGVHRFVNFYLDSDFSAAHTVLNRVRGSAGGPRAKESIQELLARFAGIADPVLIPEDESVDRATLEGATLALSAPKSAARVALQELADRFSPQRKRGRKRQRVGSWFGNRAD